MKTIKELKALKYNEKGYPSARMKIQALKDVSGLIDELEEATGSVVVCEALEDLKARIEG